MLCIVTEAFPEYLRLHFCQITWTVCVADDSHELWSLCLKIKKKYLGRCLLQFCITRVKTATKISSLAEYIQFKGHNSVRYFVPSSGKGSAPEGKNLLPLGANSFLLEQIPFQKGINVQENKQKVTKVVSLVKRGRQSTKCVHSP